MRTKPARHASATPHPCHANHPDVMGTRNSWGWCGRPSCEKPLHLQKPNPSVKPGEGSGSFDKEQDNSDFTFHKGPPSGTGEAAMSTGSAVSDAEDEETCPRTLKRTQHKTTCRFSDEDLEESEGVEGRVQMERRISRKHGQSQRNAANARERARMRVLSKAFSRLKTSLPWVPADTKLSKLDTLRLASSYISHLRQLLQDNRYEQGFVHPVNLTWPFMMTGRTEEDFSSSVRLFGTTS